MCRGEASRAGLKLRIEATFIFHDNSAHLKLHDAVAHHGATSLSEEKLLREPREPQDELRARSLWCLEMRAQL